MEKQLIPNKKSVAAHKDAEEEFFLRCEVQAIIPVVRNNGAEVLYYILSIITAGLFAMMFIWSRKLWKNFRFRKTSVEEATHIILINEHGEESLHPKSSELDTSENLQTVIVYRYMKYIYDGGEWVMQRNILRFPHNEIHKMIHGIRAENHEMLVQVFGKNSTKINVDSIMKIFTEEALSSFNIYQLFACVVWCFRDYVPYATLIFIFLIISIIFTIHLVRSEQQKLNSMSVSSIVTVHRKRFDPNTKSFIHFTESVDSQTLVPGDIVEVTADEKVCADLILLDGQTLIDESLLTGESVPMLKVPVSKNDDIFNDDNKENILFAGTYCLTSVGSTDKSKPAQAMVYQIGFGTMKGRLIRSIMYSNPTQYKFEKDSNFFTLYLLCIALTFVGIYYYIVFTKFTKTGGDVIQVILPSMDMIFTMVPPGLSLSLSMGVEYAQSRLKKKGIVALKGRLLNAAGRMKAVYFDKTGTLTLNEMKLHTVVINRKSAAAAENLMESGKDKYGLLDLEHGKPEDKLKCKKMNANEHGLLLRNFAANNSLTYVNGQILGDPMEEELFRYANAGMMDEEDENDPLRGQIKYFKRIRIDDEGNNVILNPHMSTQQIRESILQSIRRASGNVNIHEHDGLASRNPSMAVKGKGNLESVHSAAGDPQLIERSRANTGVPRPVTNKASQIDEAYEQKLMKEAEESMKPLYILGILDFKPQLQRMSVLVRDSGLNANFVFTKGAPEKVIKLCRPETLPHDIDNVVKKLAKNGYRILAFGYKQISLTASLTSPRDTYESDLDFQGLGVFKNNLKEQTRPTIEHLRANEFKVGMITGDNINTAVSIAKNCKMVDPDTETIGVFTFDGNILNFTELEDNEDTDLVDVGSMHEQESQLRSQRANSRIDKFGKIKKRRGAIDSENFERIVQRYQLYEAVVIDLDNPVIKQIALDCGVFARMNPEQKALIIRIMKTYFKGFDVTVGFCGDGANDCIALKEADIGISLSKTEASLSAPFISSIEDISCVELVSCEGKAALTTNFDCFRFFCLYSIIQTIGLIILFSMKTEFSGAVYITCDIFMALNIANCMGMLEPVKSLRKELPYSSLFNKELLLSIFLNCGLAFIYYFSGLRIVRLDPNWRPTSSYIPADDDGPWSDQGTYDTTVSSF